LNRWMKRVSTRVAVLPVPGMTNSFHMRVPTGKSQ